MRCGAPLSHGGSGACRISTPLGRAREPAEARFVAASTMLICGLAPCGGGGTTRLGPGRNGCVTATSGTPTAARIASCSVTTSARRGAAARSASPRCGAGSALARELAAEAARRARDADQRTGARRPPAAREHEQRAARLGQRRPLAEQRAALARAPSAAPMTTATRSTASSSEQPDELARGSTRALAGDARRSRSSHVP